MESLKGRKAILTGASGGIGVPVAEALAKAGMDLLLVAHPGAGLPEVAAGLDGYGIRSSVLVADLRDPSQYGVVVERAMAEFGRVDVLVNNAGVEFSLPYEQLTEAQIRQVIAVNLEAPMMLSRLVLPGMLARRTGHIVNLSSLAGKSGPAFQEPLRGHESGVDGVYVLAASVVPWHGGQCFGRLPGIRRGGDLQSAQGEEWGGRPGAPGRLPASESGAGGSARRPQRRRGDPRQPVSAAAGAGLGHAVAGVRGVVDALARGE
ncbi:MAG: SDR family NAD(P)-dependent oxidoreductase [Verrucomicrobia bacterium]|nr:SDR family NAD(P)-dependent oxidoreductase [Verrucomicrobiota bacterium]